MSQLQPEGNNDDVQLTPVLELAPYEYAREGREIPDSSASSDEREQFWFDCPADSGITGVTPILLGSWLVPLAQLSDAHSLEQILRVERCHNDEDSDADVCFPNDPDNTIAFNGGYALTINGQVEITPRCCGDLSDLDNWRNAAAHRAREEAQVWIGHPEIYVHFDGDCLCFTDSPYEGPVAWDGALRVAPKALEAAADRAEQEVVAFAAILLPVVAKLTPPGGAEDATEILTGLA